VSAGPSDSVEEYEPVYERFETAGPDDRGDPSSQVGRPLASGAQPDLLAFRVAGEEASSESLATFCSGSSTAKAT